MEQKGREKMVQSFKDAAARGKSIEERVRASMAIFQNSNTNFFDSDVLKNVNVVSAKEGKVEFDFIVTEKMCNNSGTMHGGCIATMFDDLTSIPAFTIARPGFLEGGTMSRTLTCTYLRAIYPGQNVRVVAEVIAAGKTMCHFRGDMITEDGKIAATCIHDKLPRHQKPKL